MIWVKIQAPPLNIAVYLESYFTFLNPHFHSCKIEKIIDPSWNLLGVKVNILHSIERFLSLIMIMYICPLQKNELNVPEMYKVKTENSNFVLWRS